MKAWFEEKNAPEPGTLLCYIDDLDIGEVKEFEFGNNIKHKFRMFLYRSELDILAYMNRCPHFNVPLNVECGEFFTADGAEFQCCHHYAKFDKESGLCTGGPCEGRSLTKIDIDLLEGCVTIATDITCSD